MNRVWADIDLNALCKNIDVIRKRVGRRTKILAVIKSDAYGHGMVKVARALAGMQGPLFFGIGRPEEAVCLREAGIQTKLLLLGPFLSSEVDALVQYDVTPTVGDLTGALFLNEAAKAQGKKVGVHIKVDTGMGRSGVWHGEALGFTGKFLKKCPNLELEGVLTHFSDADSSKDKFTRTQLTAFTKFTRRLEQSNVRPRFVHAANSAALLRYRFAELNMVRPGLCIYGVQPVVLRRSLKLMPVLSWKSRVTLVREVPKGRFVSYQKSYQTTRRTRIATVSVGYADGYPASLSNCGRVLIRGKFAPVIGRVTMDQLLVDASRIPKVEPSDEVVLVGKQGKAEILVEELSQKAGILPYELLCSLGRCIHRNYKEL